ncbi:MAG: hypothetical protein ABR584_12910, partial [Candidatus Baltobacteraceae bacterium]
HQMAWILLGFLGPEFEEFGPLLRILRLGSTGRGAANAAELEALRIAMTNPTVGKVLESVKMTDPRWPADKGWVKMARNINGIEVHWVRNTLTGALDDFKIK